MLRQQSELEHLDREWEMEREQYMVTGKYGNTHLPASDGAYIGGALVVAIFGGVWTVMSISIQAPFFFPIFGLFFIAAGVWNCLSNLGKSDQYQLAKQRYENRRAQLLAHHTGARSGANENRLRSG